MSNFEKVLTWSRHFRAPAPGYNKKGDIPEKQRELCQGLIEEEKSELFAAMRAKDEVGIADGCADLLWVVYRCAATYGIPIDDVFDAVYISNMTKGDVNGEPILREDGKILKGPDFQPPTPAIRAFLKMTEPF